MRSLIVSVLKPSALRDQSLSVKNVIGLLKIIASLVRVTRNESYHGPLHPFACPRNCVVLYVVIEL